MTARTLLLGALLMWGGAQGVYAKRYAVIVGCNNGGGGAVPLKFAETDAQECALIVRTLGGFAAENIALLTGADSAAVRREFNRTDSLIRTDSDPQSLFLFYYSGHADVGRLKLGAGGFSLKKIRDYFEDLPAAVKIGIFDACNSGVITTFKGGKAAEPFFFQQRRDIKGQVIIASSSAVEAAQESQTLKGSIFSHHWFNALRGSADFAGDGRITVNEAYQYAYRKTIETTALIAGEVQHPVFKFDIQGQGDIVLTTLTKTEGGVLFDKASEGKFLVLSDDYINVFADFYKKKGSESFIALSPGAYTIVHAVGRDVGTGVFMLHARETYRYDNSSLAFTSALATGKKGATPGLADTTQAASSPLSVYSWGIGLAGERISPAGGAPPRGLAGLSLVNWLYVSSQCNFFCDGLFMPAGTNAAVSAGFDFLPAKTALNPYIGAGAGILYSEKAATTFANRIGVGLVGRMGCLLDLNDRLQIRVQIPGMIFAQHGIGYRVGLEAACVFSGPYKNVRVLRL